ncbi:MAG: efflux RND transporter periplasmic adaptor subunit, partial [Flavobacteriaceae bacterium TMED206]
MKKIIRYLLLFTVIFSGLFSIAYFIKSNSKGNITYETKTPFITNIERKTVATGKVIPEDEVEIKPQVQGILSQIYVEEGNFVKQGDIIAKIKIVPDEGQLNSAKGRLANSRLVFKNSEIDFKRNQNLLKKGIISVKEFQDIKLNFNRSKQDLLNAENDFKIIKSGSAGGMATANTDVRATVPGTVLEIPVKEGDQVIESNSFNNGTTIAIIADLNKMIFEGKVDETDVNKMFLGMPLKVSLGAIDDKFFDAKLKFIAPKGNEEEGIVQFKIEGDLKLDKEFTIRAGYSANASFILERKDSILSISEALLQFDKDSDKPYVEIETSDQKFKRRNIEIGISDGINVEVISGINLNDKVKIWNRTQ